MAKVVFCQRIYYALFGLTSISAVLKDSGHDVELFMNESIDKIVNSSQSPCRRLYNADRDR